MQTPPIPCSFFLTATGNCVDLLCREWAALFKRKMKRPLARGIWLLAVTPLLLLMTLLNGFCLALDECLFPSYRHQPVKAPVFVLGPPRSGTTHLHRTLALDTERFVVSPAWEVMLAPSIVQKKLLRGLIRLDRKSGRFLARLVDWVERRGLQAFDETHPGSIRDAEEDYFYLGSLLACTGWMLAFPNWPGFDRVLPGLPGMTDGHRRRALAFYRLCLQKQLYVDGGTRTLLSKNASFSSWLDLLPECFPDARFVVCMRDPVKTLPSMLSTAEKAMRGFWAEQKGDPMRDRLLKSMKAHYQVLYDQVPRLESGRGLVVENRELKEKLPEVIRELNCRLDLCFSDGFLQVIQSLGEQSRAHRSPHQYDLKTYGLQEQDLLESCPALASTLSTPQ